MPSLWRRRADDPLLLRPRLTFLQPTLRLASGAPIFGDEWEVRIAHERKNVLVDLPSRRVLTCTHARDPPAPDGDM